MNIEKREVKQLVLTDLKGLDPVKVFVENIADGKGQITITCYGKAWSAYWGAMGHRTLERFFCDCGNEYIAKNLSPIDEEIFDVDAINKLAQSKGIECGRDDPWNDYDFLATLLGDDSGIWYSELPKKPNPDYQYLCKIISAVKAAFIEMELAA